MNKTLFAEFNKVYESALEASRIVSKELNAYWLELGIDVDLISHLELCVVEIVNNTFIHAYQHQQGLPVEVRSELTVEGSEKLLTISISDHGEKMNPLEFEKNLVGEFIEADPEVESTWVNSGRGVLIVSSLMDKIELIADEDKNTFKMTKILK
ncbi:MAG: ATP-binding protein [Alteromonadales bacterium]|nr:ATP-binding protein [Alteromonadales bacterium]